MQSSNKGILRLIYNSSTFISEKSFTCEVGNELGVWMGRDA